MEQRHGIGNLGRGEGYALCTHLMPMKALRSDKILSILRVVGVAVVMAGVHGSGRGIRWSRTVERHIQEREVKAHVTPRTPPLGSIDGY